MTKNKDITTSTYTVLLVKRMLLGAVIAFVLMAFFLKGAQAQPEWGKFWMIRPLVVISLAGATGGAFYHFMDGVSYRGGWRRVLAIIASIIVYIIGLWLGTVLGLDGTLWN